MNESMNESMADSRTPYSHVDSPGSLSTCFLEFSFIASPFAFCVLATCSQLAFTRDLLCIYFHFVARFGRQRHSSDIGRRYFHAALSDVILVV
jgi:hypothetical protein